jgi:hypothetical protein
MNYGGEVLDTGKILIRFFLNASLYFLKPNIASKSKSIEFTEIGKNHRIIFSPRG